MKKSDEKFEIDSVRDSAIALLRILRRQARRPFVLEITGTPKAGKTTLIGMLDSFLRDCGWRVHILKERAGECPLPMKGHFFFNTWTMGTMLAGLLDAVDREHDLVILDRGIFDSLIWLQMQRENGQVSDEEFCAFERFVALERWRQFTDTVCLLEVDFETAMARENAGRLLPRSGSVMNPSFLSDYNRTLVRLRREWRKTFHFIDVENARTPHHGTIALAAQTLDAARTWSDPPIAVLSRRGAEALLPRNALRWSSALWNKLQAHVQYRRRSLVEDNPDWVQLLACGAETYAGKVFVVVRRPHRDDAISRRRDHSAMIWRGCHVTKPRRDVFGLEYLQAEVLRRLRADLHLGELNATPKPRGIVWEPDGKEACHLGLVFEVPVKQKVARSLDQKRFKTNGRAPWMESRFVTRDELLQKTVLDDAPSKRSYTLESWSKLILDQRWLP